MIRLEPIKEIPKLRWTRFSAFEFDHQDDRARQRLVAGSSVIRLIFEDKVPIMIAGLYRASLVSTPFLWTLITKDFKNLSIRNLRNLIHQVSVYTPHCETLVADNNKDAKRLARLFKFRPTIHLVDHEGTPYRLWERG